MATPLTATATRTDTTRGLLMPSPRLRPATATAMLPTAMATGLTAMATPATATATTRGLLMLSPAAPTAMLPTAMATPATLTATATTKLFQPPKYSMRGPRRQ